jgi:hypothetical protein
MSQIVLPRFFKNKTRFNTQRSSENKANVKGKLSVYVVSKTHPQMYSLMFSYNAVRQRQVRRSDPRCRSYPTDDTQVRSTAPNKAQECPGQTQIALSKMEKTAKTQDQQARAAIDALGYLPPAPCSPVSFTPSIRRPSTPATLPRRVGSGGRTQRDHKVDCTFLSPVLFPGLRFW